MNDDLAPRRRAKAAADRVAADCAADMARVARLSAAEAQAWAIANSVRHHPSNGRPYDHQEEQ